MLRREALFSLLVAVGCAGLEAPEEAQLEQPIIGGTIDTGQNLFVPLIFTLDEQGRINGHCTGELITPRIVMTAAHCSPVEKDHDHIFGNEVVFADSWNERNGTLVGLKGRRDVIKAWWHPSFDVINFNVGNDIALLLMESPAPTDIKPVPFNRFRLVASDLNKDVRVVGFGLNGSAMQTLWDREQVTVPLLSYTDLHIKFGNMEQAFCQGDSGGPNFMTFGGIEMVTGITSFGPAGAECHGPGNSTRVDKFLTEINAFIAANDPQPTANCGMDGICGTGCTAPDPDCKCAADGFCTTACDDSERDPDCPAGCSENDKCIRTGCPEPDPDCGTLTVGEACLGNNDCENGHCVVGTDNSTRVCSPECDGESCPSGFTCQMSGSPRLCEIGSSGGCSIGGRGTSLAGVALLLALAVFVARRRHGR